MISLFWKRRKGAYVDPLKYFQFCELKVHESNLFCSVPPPSPPSPHHPPQYGFIVMDGNGTLYGTLAGNTREILYRFTVELPKKHGRGGQSAARFGRLRMEKRRNYVRKV